MHTLLLPIKLGYDIRTNFNKSGYLDKFGKFRIPKVIDFVGVLETRNGVG
jgi:hypothetical protein